MKLFGFIYFILLLSHFAFADTQADCQYSPTFAGSNCPDNHPSFRSALGYYDSTSQTTTSTLRVFSNPYSSSYSNSYSNASQSSDRPSFRDAVSGGSYRSTSDRGSNSGSYGYTPASAAAKASVSDGQRSNSSQPSFRSAVTKDVYVSPQPLSQLRPDPEAQPASGSNTNSQNNNSTSDGTFIGGPDIFRGPEKSTAVELPPNVKLPDYDDGQTHPVTPLLPTESNRQVLESACPDCMNEEAYREKFKGLKDIADQISGPEHLLRTAAHNMMKIIHMRCDANDVFVPTMYVTNLEYCHGAKTEKCDRMHGGPNFVYGSDQVEKYTNDQKTGDIYRTPISSQVANTRVSDSKNDTRTCKDLHDHPFMFYVSGRGHFSGNKLDPFNQRGTEPNTFDCSETINALVAPSGLKWSASDKNIATAYNRTTASLTALARSSERDKNSCISIPSFQGDDSIHSGDMYVLRRNVNGKNEDMGHTFMFDDVKEDPFNLAGVTSSSECVGKNSIIDPSQFHFSIIQSSGTAVDRQVFEKFKGIDLTLEQNYDKLNHVDHDNPADSCYDYGKPKTCDMRERFEDWGGQVIALAQKACLAKVSKLNGHPVAYKAEEKLDTRKLIGTVRPDDKGYIAGVLIRHKGPTPACSFPKPPEIVGSKCVADCLEK